MEKNPVKIRSVVLFTLTFSAIRLLNGREADVVEVKVNGSWGGVCDDGFSFSEAHVVCRQMGYKLGAEQVSLIYTKTDTIQVPQPIGCHSSCGP